MVSSIFEAVGNGDLNRLQKSIAFHKIIDDDWTDYELLIASLNQENKDVIKLLLNNGCRVQHISKNHFVDSPLYCAVFKQDEDILELLLKKVSLTAIDYECESVFEPISKTSHEKIKLILKAYIVKKINPPDYDGFMPFHLACYIGDINLVKQFLNLNCDPDCCIHAHAKSFAGYSALHFAVESKCTQAVELLLQVCRNIIVKDLKDKSPFYLACEKKIEPIIGLFMKAYSQNDVQCNADEAFSVLHKNLFNEDLTYCHRHATADSWTSWTLLHFAVARQNNEIVKFLLETCEDKLIDVADECGLTALHLACQCSFKAFHEVLVRSESLDNECKSAEKSAPVEIVEMLLTKGSDANAKDDFDRTPLFHVLDTFRMIKPSGISQAMRSNLILVRLQLVQVLLNYHAKVDLADKDGTTLLHQLSDRDTVFYEGDKVKLAQQLLAMGADVNARTRQNVTPLFLSIRNKFLDLAAVYVDWSADVNCACTHFNKFTPLHALAYYNEYSRSSVRLLRRLLERGADAKAVETDGATALHVAIDCHGLEGDLVVADERDEMAIALLEHGASVDALDRHRQTPLHRACLNRYDKGASVLLEHGADVNVEDEFAHTPLDYAGYRLKLESSASFLHTLRHHVHKLKLVGRQRVSRRTERCLRQLEKLYAREFAVPRIDEFVARCAAELARMRQLRLDNYTTLRDILLKSADDMARHAKNDEFASIVRRDEFKLYGYLLRLQYRRGLTRSKLAEPAQASLKALMSGCELPDSSVRIIFEYLDNADLQSLIQAS